MPYVRLAWLSQVWLQEFAWTEEDEDAMLEARSLALPAQYNQQPLFCFETMMHMLYWSCLAYEHKRVSLQHACKFGQKEKIVTFSRMQWKSLLLLPCTWQQLISLHTIPCFQQQAI